MIWNLAKARWLHGSTLAGVLALLTSAGWIGAGDEPASPAGSAAGAAMPDRAIAKDTTAGALVGKKSPEKIVRDSDDWTFRPTVLIRRGTSQGSGTIIASLDGDTLILTAAHVIRGRGPITVELHRYNLGLEHLPLNTAKWPRQVPAEQAASDTAADIAIVRIRNMVILPFVARLGPADEEPPDKAELTSVGIDLGAKLSSWKTNLVEVLWFELNDSGTDRPFLVTARIPEHGRSGGGIFDQSGQLVGVCVGHAELEPVKGRRMGVFSSVENVREMLKRSDLTSVLDQSEAARKTRLARSQPAGHRLNRPSRSAVTPTEAENKALRP